MRVSSFGTVMPRRRSSEAVTPTASAGPASVSMRLQPQVTSPARDAPSRNRSSLSVVGEASPAASSRRRSRVAAGSFAAPPKASSKARPPALANAGASPPAGQSSSAPSPAKPASAGSCASAPARPSQTCPDSLIPLRSSAGDSSPREYA
ncbi:MAG: hypothetical protein DI537_01185 [Stutzerimonas stutzeri]|nr:MAG: hypothetical protein DI537_01185 [Stutzerimonas stutzeri]